MTRLFTTTATLMAALLITAATFAEVTRVPIAHTVAAMPIVA
jgi:hypothetical protein